MKNILRHMRNKMIAPMILESTKMQNEFAALRRDYLDLCEKMDAHNRDIDNRLENINKKLDLYSLQIYRSNDESNFYAQKRLFRNIPEATGSLLLYQSVNSALLKKLTEFCDNYNLDYWLWCGSLIAAVGRNKAIPWDDDIDICMMRSDFKKLFDKVKNDKEYQITVVYDYLSKNRQYRFVSRNNDIFNCIDIVVCDWSTGSDLLLDKKYKDEVADFEQELTDDSSIRHWNDAKYLFFGDSRFTYQPMQFDYNNGNISADNRTIKKIELLFNEFITHMIEIGIFCDAKNAKAVAYGPDNLFNNKNRKDLWDKNIIFPTHKIQYDGFLVRVPNREEEFCSICYPGWPYVPDDISSHSHIPTSVMEDYKTLEAMERFLSGPINNPNNN